MKALFAYYDSASDKIMNCTEGSLVWYHEKGHQEQAKSGLMGAFQMVIGNLVVLAVAADIATPGSWIARVLMLTIAMMIIFIEVDAWVYALRNYNPKGSNKDEKSV